MPAKLSPMLSYSGEEAAARWMGNFVADQAAFRTYLQERVRSRVDDDDQAKPFEAELRGMASTGMETRFVEQLLKAVPEEKSWAVGEALAECILMDDSTRTICWPWNLVRDRRTPRASLPGADLVGFCKHGDVVVLLLGEVKTSSDIATPPGVMKGSAGMAWQLEEEATRLDVQHTLLKWLRCRCLSPTHLELYRAAVARYVASLGREILLVGVLLRDTSPNELDISSRAKWLAQRLPSPTRIELAAWYLPDKIDSWPDLLEVTSP